MDKENILVKVRGIADEVAREEAIETDKNCSWPKKSMQALQDAGLTGLVIPEEYGGLGMHLRELAEVCEVLGQYSGSLGLCFGMHCVGSAVIAAKATEYQIETYLKPIAAGKHITTLALSEPGTGAHFYYPQTTLMAAGSESFKVSGTKAFATNGGHADSYVVSTVAEGADAPVGHFSCVLIDRSAKGLAWGEPWKGLGMRGNSSRNVALKDVLIPAGNLLGEEGDQIWYVFNVVAPYFLIAMAGTYIGLAQSAFAIATAHLKERMHAHSATGLAENQVLQHKTGKIWSDLERTRRLIYYACDEADRGGAQAMPALCAAKADVAGCAVETVNRCMTMVGGIGYREGGMLDRILRDVRAADVMSPTTDLLLTWIGRVQLEQPVLD